LTSALDGDEWSASLYGRFTPRERVSDIDWIEGWVGSRAGLDTVVRKKNSQPLPGLEPPIAHPVAQQINLGTTRDSFPGGKTVRA